MKTLESIDRGIEQVKGVLFEDMKTLRLAMRHNGFDFERYYDYGWGGRLLAWGKTTNNVDVLMEFNVCSHNGKWFIGDVFCKGTYGRRE